MKAKIKFEDGKEYIADLIPIPSEPKPEKDVDNLEYPGWEFPAIYLLEKIKLQ